MNRRSTPILAFLALAAVACQDVQDPAVDFQVRDGMHGGNSAFYFLPPLVPSPSYSGVFDPTLAPLLEAFVTGPFTATPVGDVNGDGYMDWEPGNDAQQHPAVACENTRAVPALPAPTLGTGESYATAWNTKKKGPDAVTIGAVYRICVALRAGSQVLPLGWRDVMPDDGGSDQPRSTEQSPTYQFSAGSNLPIKFRIEQGVLNQALCAESNGTINYDCTAALLANEGDEAVCVGSTCSLTAGDLSDPTLFLVERLPCYGDNPNIPSGHEPDAQGVNWIQGLDLPQYAGCIQVTVFDPNWNGFNTAGVVGACFFDESGPMLVGEQDESLRLHMQEDGTTTVVALDRVPAASALEANQCQGSLTANMPPPPDASLGARLAWQLRQGWRSVKRAVNPWFAPPDAVAFHTGFGGHTTLKGVEDGISPSVAAQLDAPQIQFHVTQNGDAKVYLLAWALVSQMEKYQLGATDNFVPPEPITVTVGQPVPVKVLVTDNGEERSVDTGTCRPAPDGNGQVCSRFVDPRPVGRAEVHFSADNGAEVSLPSVFTSCSEAWAPDWLPGASVDDCAPSAAAPHGVAEVTVTPTKSGITTVTASGYGIGARPLDGFGGFVPPPDGEITLLSGSLAFQIYACDNSADGFMGPPPEINGKLPTGEWDEAQLDTVIPVNLGGNVSSMAQLYVGHDCNNLYLALAVGADAASNNSLRFVFDNNADGNEAEGDNIVSLIKNASGGWDYLDRYLSADCIGSKQANCGPADPAQHGNGAADYDQNISKFVYEFRFPLKSGDAVHDFQRSLGQSLGFYLAISLGNGTKGNTEWPDQKGNFKSYQPYVITQY